MNRWSHNYFLIIICCSAIPFFLISCGAAGSNNAPTHHGALFRTHWETLFNANPKNKKAPPRSIKKQTPASHDDPRERIVDAALALLKQSKIEPHYGAIDVQTVFAKAGFPSCFKQSTEVSQMVKKATTEDAYFTQSRPQAGDLVLFHNQFDRNRNGESDDWFTGVAVVVESHRKTLTAVTRTASAPKKIVLSPSGPMVHNYRGKLKNSFVKVPTPHDPTDAQYLAGQLYAGYINIDNILTDCRK